MKADTNIVVASTEIDTYGNQIITAADGQEYRIGVKRAHLHPLAQPDTPLILKWSNYLDKDYVSDVLVNASGPQPNPAALAASRPEAVLNSKERAAQVTTTTGHGPPIDPGGRYGKDAQIARAVALKAAVDVVIANDRENQLPTPADRVIAMARAFVPFLMATPTLTEHANALVKEGVLESPVVDQDALKGLASIAKDAKEWVGTVAEKNQWLKDTAKEMFGKDIKEITEDELSQLTAKLAEHIESQQTEGNPF